MKFHRVLLFTSIQMDITPVGDDLHVLLTCGGENRLGCTAFSTPLPDTDPVECETSVITDVEIQKISSAHTLQKTSAKRPVNAYYVPAASLSRNQMRIRSINFMKISMK